MLIHFLGKRVPHEDRELLKYSYAHIIQEAKMYTRRAAAPDYYSLDVRKYEEALRRLEKAKEGA